MTPTQYTEAVAAEVRAELGRQRRSQADLAQALGFTAATAARRLDGTVPFDVMELAVVSAWLGVPLSQLMPAQANHVEAAS
jgi:transcriptional regulator with XRE-family HTH domain